VQRADRLRAALDAEEAWQVAELAASRRLPWPDQVAAGVAWPEVAVEEAWPGRRGRWTWRVRARLELPETPGPGDTIDLSPAGARDARWRGRVLSVDGPVAELEADVDDEPPDRAWVALRHDSRTFDRQRAALARVATLDSGLARVLRGDAPWEVKEAERPREDPDLDPSQRRALGRALAAPALSVVYGPPGTGKTRTVVALLRALVGEGERPWALADSNAATDHLAVQADLAGLGVVRVGAPARIGARAAALTLDARLARHGIAPALAALDRDLRKLRAATGPAARSERRALFQERDRLVDLARAEILGAADVIACTLGSLSRYAPGLPRARTAVLDEATQATEPSAWVAAGWVERLVLAGDPHQLGPVVFQPGNGLSEGLLQRLLREAPAGVEAGRLEVQRRMHADLAELVRDVYGPAYRSHGDVADRGPTWDLPELCGPVTLVDTAGAGLDDARDATTGSWRNVGEAALVAWTAARLRAAGVEADDLGVITPYTAQVELLRRQPELAGVEVSTVNGFQGREKEVILLSLVRSNEDGAVGFATDRRRLTVALTRARRALVVFGDLSTVGRTPWVADLAERLAAAGAVRSVWEPPWSDQLPG
jgi:ATP-dependent RNA/DNA helicase IGHMBP2